MSATCPDCGRVCDDEDRFCMSCGARVAPLPARPAPGPAGQRDEFAFSARAEPGDWTQAIRGWARPMNKGFYLSWFIGAALVSVLSLYYWMQAMAAMNWQLVLLTLLPMIVAGLALWAVFGLMTYRLWTAIQDGHARTKPGMAAGFLFIPGFGLYWIFQAMWGFSKDYNALIERRRLSLTPLPPPLFMSLSICYVGTCLPYLGTFFALPSFILLVVAANKAIDAVNNLLDQIGIRPEPATETEDA